MAKAKKRRRQQRSKGNAHFLFLLALHGQLCQAFVLTPTVAVRRSTSHSESNDWRVGDVYGDLDRLESAIRRSNAEQDKQHRERLETLDYFAKERKPLRTLIRRKLLLPILASWIVSITSRAIQSFLNQVLQIHLYSFVVLPPILLWITIRRTQEDTEPPPELRGVDPEYYKFITSTEWKDPAESTKNVALCIAEQWTSVVVLFLLSGQSDAVVQTAVRLASWASIHQYPQLYFELWNRQERPHTWSVSVLQSLLKQFLFTPWFVALTLGAGLSSCNRKAVMAGYGIVAAMVGIWERKPDVGMAVYRHRKSLYCGLIVGIALAAWKLFSEPIRFMFLWMETWSLRQAIPAMFSLKALRSLIPSRRFLVPVAALALPVVHLLAWTRICQVVYTHNLSLSLDPRDFQKKFNDKAIHQWRFKLRWRTPQRVRIAFNEWKGRFWYWLFFSGSVQDRLRREYNPRRLNRARNKDSTIWEKVKNDNREVGERSTWKTNAMDQLAAKHERDYESKTFEDPLGVAVYKSLGIGLGFNFDHMSELMPGEQPTTRRLQARAAKSAIHRVKELYNAENAQEVLSRISDPEEREQKKAELRRQTQKEIDLIAKRLSDLIPTDMSLDVERKTAVQQFSDNSRDYERTSSNEFRLKSSRYSSATVQGLLKNVQPDEDDRVDYLNPSGESKEDRETFEEMSEEEEEAFIEAWMKQREAMKSADTVDDDEDENEIRTVLV